MNKELLLAVKDMALAVPERMYMENWLQSDVIFDSIDNDIGIAGESDFLGYPPCGTVGCIYGWGRVIQHAQAARITPEKFLAETGMYKVGGGTVGVMELFEIQFNQAEALAYVHRWPLRFWWRYEVAKRHGDRKAMAQAIAERIDYFVETDGEDGDLRAIRPDNHEFVYERDELVSRFWPKKGCTNPSPDSDFVISNLIEEDLPSLASVIDDWETSIAAL